MDVVFEESAEEATKRAVERDEAWIIQPEKRRRF